MMHEAPSRKPLSRGGKRAILYTRTLRSLLAALALLFVACQSSDPVQAEKDRILTPDERYLVEYYMKIIEFEKQEFDNEALRLEKKSELEREYDPERVRRAVASLEKEPERWLAIYNRINELQIRSLEKPTEAR